MKRVVATTDGHQVEAVVAVRLYGAALTDAIAAWDVEHDRDDLALAIDHGIGLLSVAAQILVDLAAERAKAGQS